MKKENLVSVLAVIYNIVVMAAKGLFGLVEAIIGLLGDVKKRADENPLEDEVNEVKSKLRKFLE